ncbi:MAG: GAF domain-containing protein [Anaerolineae bacterium]|nr:GAF domain-containing protein [Anaerolineae bacterium]
METQLKNKPLHTPQWKLIEAIQTRWESLTKPSVTIDDKEEIRRNRLLSTMLLVVAMVGGVVLAQIIILRPASLTEPDTIFALVSLVILFGLYFVNRAGHTNIAAVVFISLTGILFVLMPFLENSRPTLLYFSIVTIILIGTFFSLQRLIVSAAVILVVMGVLLQVSPWLDSTGHKQVIEALQFMAFAIAVVVTFINHQNAVERIRRAELEDANAQLRESEVLLEQRVQARTRDLTVASDVSRRTTTVLEIDTLLPQLSTLTQQGFDLYGVSIYLHDPATGILRLAAETNVDDRTADNTNVVIHIHDQLGLIPQAARKHEAVVIGDTEQTAVFRANPALPATRSEMVVPMLVGDQLVGVLDLQSRQANRFSEEDKYIITTLAEQMAIAVRNAQLFQEVETARRAAETANETKSRFLANMSHELRTPLNAILNFTAFVADGVLGDVNEEQVEVLQESIASGKHLLSLINDVLDITKIEAGMMELFIEKVDIHAELTSAVSVGRGLIKEKPIKLLTEIADDLPTTYGDKRRLRQVFLNLISNAAKFTSEGEITITGQRWEDGVEVIVKDTGMGIAPEEHHKVFESFKQAKHDLTGTVGTGLGMPITKYFVEMHDGQIWFESQLGAGTTFYVRLPQLSQQDAEKINELAQMDQSCAD